MKWLELSLISVVFMSLGILGAKYATLKGLKGPLILFYFSISAFIIALAYMLYSKESFAIEPIYLIGIFIGAGIILLGNLFIIKALDMAPNPGYVAAILSMQTIIITVAAIFLFKSSISIINAAGIALAIASIILIGAK